VKEDTVQSKRLVARKELSRAIVNMRDKYHYLPVVGLNSFSWSSDQVGHSLVEVGEGSFSLFWESIDETFSANEYERDWRLAHSDVELFRSVEHQLQNIYRYNAGFKTNKISVAAHSDLVFSLSKHLFDLRDIHREALLHDIHEAVTGDVIYQVKRLIPWFDQLETIVNRRLKHFIFSGYEDPDKNVSRAVHLCDMLAFYIEVDNKSSWPISRRIVPDFWFWAYNEYVGVTNWTSTHVMDFNSFKANVKTAGQDYLLFNQSMESRLGEVGLK